uniref:HSF-type DNA-binding domain-containing protein n=1 Tax=Fibrocapsa japonica TaxID=94617 RepID=A0A7S2V6P5_9STRA
MMRIPEEHPHTLTHHDSSLFPQKLMELLNSESDCAVGWAEHGRCFFIRNAKLFADEILPRYFRHGKYSSFQRQLNLYGFRRVFKGPDSGAYYHPHFIRDQPSLVAHIKRSGRNSNNNSSSSSSNNNHKHSTNNSIRVHASQLFGRTAVQNPSSEFSNSSFPLTEPPIEKKFQSSSTPPVDPNTAAEYGFNVALDSLYRNYMQQKGEQQRSAKKGKQVSVLEEVTIADFDPFNTAAITLARPASLQDLADLLSECKTSNPVILQRTDTFKELGNLFEISEVESQLEKFCSQVS